MKMKLASILIALMVFACGSEKDEPVVHDRGKGEMTEHQPDEPVKLFGDTQIAPVVRKQPHPEVVSAQKIQRTIIVPDEVKGKWKGVKLLIKEVGGSNETKTVDIGSEFDIPRSNLHVKVGDFLPHMSIGQSAFTSVSNNTVNPAVHLIITENNQVVFNGWAYSNYPDMYNFKHERFSVTLVDYIPAG